MFWIELAVASIALIHILISKTNSLAALLWIVFVVLWPLAGGAVYWVFGINRVWNANRRMGTVQWTDQSLPVARLPDGLAEQAPLLQVGGRVTGQPFTEGGHVELLVNGEAAFPAMLSAIDTAQTEVLLASYIFDRDHTGRQFVDALAAARQRGVRVCVLLDDVGRRHSFPTVTGWFTQAQIEYRLFMPLRLLPPSLSINLRNHRKLLLVDQQAGFAGGMNIGDRQLIKGDSALKAADLHFLLSGPAVADLRALFLQDWRASGGLPLVPPAPLTRTGVVQPSDLRSSLPPLNGGGQIRIVPDGPDERLHHLAQLIAGVVSAARHRVVVITPYFLPDRRLVGALQSAALRGVAVTVLIPQASNWPIVRWALNHGVWELLSAGVQVFEQAPPFVHTKCLLIDDDYALVGSANIDSRSLRLNFEVGIEVVDPTFVAALDHYVATALVRSSAVTSEQVGARSLLVRLRDAISGLFAPYL